MEIHTYEKWYYLYFNEIAEERASELIAPVYSHTVDENLKPVKLIVIL